MKTLAAILVAAGLTISLSYKHTECTSDCTTSRVGRAVLTSLEGYYPKCYKDSAGRWTIGYGHLIRPGDSCQFLRPADAIKLLQADLRPKEKAINADISRKKHQSEFDAVSILVFNIGESAFHASHLRPHIQQIDMDVGSLWLEWDKITVNGVKVPSKGLLYRRQIEYSLYTS